MIGQTLKIQAVNVKGNGPETSLCLNYHNGCYGKNTVFVQPVPRYRFKRRRQMGKKTPSNKGGIFFHSCLRKSCADSKSLSFNVSVLTP